MLGSHDKAQTQGDILNRKNHGRQRVPVSNASARGTNYPRESLEIPAAVRVAWRLVVRHGDLQVFDIGH